MEAGGPLANNILKCQLKPVSASDYAVQFTAAELADLQSIFPGGVCDWSKPGVGQQPSVTWSAFNDCSGAAAASGNCVPAVQASLVPTVVNLRTTNGLVTVLLTAPAGVDLRQWTISNVRLEGAAAVHSATTADGNSVVAAFNRSALAALPEGPAVPVTLTATLSRNGIDPIVVKTTTARVIR
jgi:hypothetical protein